MIDKERDAVKMMVLMNAVEFLGAGYPPNNDELQLDFVSAMMDMKSLISSLTASKIRVLSVKWKDFTRSLCTNNQPTTV